MRVGTGGAAGGRDAAPRRRVAIVIPTGDRRAHPATECAAALERTTRGHDVDIRWIESRGPGFSYSKSINRGIREAKDADAWVLLNDDAFMDDGWLDAMLDAARARPDVGVVGAVLRYRDGSLQHAGGRILLDPAEYVGVALRHKAPFWALRSLRAHKFRAYPYMFEHYTTLDKRHRLDFLTGACVLVTKPLLDKIGLYDESFTFGAEDIDHCMRARQAGFELAMATKCTGVHLHHVSGKKYKLSTEESQGTFRQRWDAATIRRLTRGAGRTGVYWP